MGAPDLLQGLRRAGFSLSVSPSGDLAVKPASKLTNDQRATIKAHKADIVQALRCPAPPHSQDFDREAFEERAAIMEHDGGLSRADAEALAADLCGKPPDPDRYCWPFSVAMNTAEIDTFTHRVGMFAGHGLDYPEAEALADRLVIRDREADDRRLCLECRHLQRRTGLWNCAQRHRVALAMPADLVKRLQRCEGFKG